MKNCGRGLSPKFMEDLKSDTGLGLNRILDAVKNDATLALEIRGNYINIYYRGGNLMKITEKSGVYSVFFDLKYVITGQSYKLPLTLSAFSDVSEWLEKIPLLKYEMDLWFGQHPKNEREFQQLMIRENNFKGTGKGTDYFICDIEYDNSDDSRFDLIAVYWPSSSQERKNQNVGLAFIEMKYGDGALKNSAGILAHIHDMESYLNPDQNTLGSLKEEMKTVFNQKQALGLIDNQKHIEQFTDSKPEYILVFANHDPDSSILYDELQKVRTAVCNRNLPFDLRFATSNFMGYGLYQQNIYNLDEFMERFRNQIYSKNP